MSKKLSISALQSKETLSRIRREKYLKLLVYGGG